ncbi:MAG: tail fiber domain-containing protein [Dysgonamonadaceae bacterium]|jgi:hypothetical protein|nr:tail fiber domain-containing protein [Dysgonamonadaceae bacterium]
MKRIFLPVILLAFIANVSAQLHVTSAGNVGVETTTPGYTLDVAGDINLLGSTANIIAWTSDVPIMFKVNGSDLAGNTGNAEQTNVSFGYRSLSSNPTGDYNTAIGDRALRYNTTGYENAAFGSWSLLSNTTGNNNTAYGDLSLYNNVTGNNNTAIGAKAKASTTNLNNIIAIGYQATATASNEARIGNNNITSIGGCVAWTTFLSDKRVKKNIRDDVPGLDFINRLQPVTYNIDLDAIDKLRNIGEKPSRDGASQELTDAEKEAREATEKIVQTGFLAQDVEEVAKSIGYDFSGVDVDGIGVYGLRYAEFVVPLVKAVQELSEQNERLQALVYSLLEKEDAPALKSAYTTGLQEAASKGASLQQNSPNPFNQSTVIRYTLPQNGKSAQLVINNTAGAIVRQIPLQAGTESVTIESGALSADIYYYSLYVGNSLIDTKKMILTK